MKASFFSFIFISLGIATFAQQPLKSHPKSTKGWTDLFNTYLSNTIKPENVWTVENGVLTASEDQNIWTNKEYTNFILDLEFQTADGTNSGVVVHASDTDNWIPNSVEIQIADDYSEQWSKADKTWQCAAFFGHLAAKKSNVKKPGEWNRYTISSIGQRIWIVLNGEFVNEIDMSKWTSGSTNPDGSKIPEWLNKPWAKLPVKGYIGLQGKHAGAPVYFRNMKIKEI